MQHTELASYGSSFRLCSSTMPTLPVALFFTCLVFHACSARVQDLEGTGGPLKRSMPLGSPGRNKGRGNAKQPTSGNVIASSSEQVSQKAAGLKERENPGRSLLGFEAQVTMEANTGDSKETYHINETSMIMDYAGPHKKQPIHN